MGHISMTETFTEAQEEVTLFIQVQTNATTDIYKMSFDNALCEKCPTAQYGYSEDYSDATVFNQVVYGTATTRITNGDELNSAYNLTLTTVQSELPDGSASALKVSKVKTGHTYTFIGIAMGPVSQGETYTVSFRYKELDGTKIASRHMALSSAMNPRYGGSTYKITDPVTLAEGLNEITCTFTQDYENLVLWMQIVVTDTSDTFSFSISDVNAIKHPTAQYGYGEDYSDATIFNQVVYGTATTFIKNGSGANDVFDMSIITSGTDLPDGATSALKVVKQATGHHYTWVSVAMGSVKSGEKYMFSFDFKGIDATNIGSRRVTLTSSLDPAQGLANKIIDDVSFNEGNTWFEYDFTQDYDNIVLWIQIAGNDWGDGYSFSLSNVKAVKHNYGYSENFENATAYGSTVCGDITVYTKNAGNGEYSATLTSDATELPDGVNKGMKIEKSALSGHTYTYVNFVFGSVKQGETYTFGFNSKVVSASDGFGMCYSLSSSITPDRTSVENFQNNVAINNGGQVSFEWTADKDYDNIAIWVQISNSTWNSGTYSVTFGDVKCVKNA